MLPSIDTKPWVLTFKKVGYDRNTEARKPEFLTNIKAEVIRRFLHDPKSRFIDLTDDNGNLKETLEKKEIESLRLISDTTTNTSEDRWICGYGTKHPMNVWPANKCGCREKYDISESRFRDHMQNAFGINHSHEITDRMRETFLKNKTLVEA